MTGESVTVYRGATDKMGNPNKASHGTVTGVFAWGSARRDKSFRGDSHAFLAELYVLRGADLQARDRIKRANGEEYAVVGHSKWDQVHPFDDFDFEWMVFQLEAMNG